MSNIEFLVHDIRCEPKFALVSGIVNKGDIPIGATFTYVRQVSEDVHDIHLTVFKIITYRHEIDSLPQGMSGELHLTGAGVEMLMKHSMLEA